MKRHHKRYGERHRDGWHAVPGPDEQPGWGRQRSRGMREGEGRGHARGRGGRGSGHHGGDGGRGHRRGRRMFEGGELRHVMLLLMEAEPRHGYDIIREIDKRAGGAYAPSPGIIYPTLTLLDEMGLIAAQGSEGAKKLFGITPEGVVHLNEHRTAAQAALMRLEALAVKDAALDTGPVFRAMSNLKAALRQRLGGGPGKELVFAVADVIDEAARKIERIATTDTTA